MKWPPEIIGGLFCDTMDYEGIEFWYEYIIELEEKLKPKKK